MRLPSGACTPSTHLLQGRAGEQFDTFTFNVDLPCIDTMHEYFAFCVCFRTSAGEYWDNNGGRNYALMSAERQRHIDTRPVAHSCDHRELDRPEDGARTSDAW